MNLISYFLHNYRYVANLMFHVPFPTVERPRVLLLIGPETIVFSLPVQTPLPMRYMAYHVIYFFVS